MGSATRLFLSVGATGLEKGATGGGFMEGALNTQGDPIGVGEFGARSVGNAAQNKRDGGLEQFVVNR